MRTHDRRAILERVGVRAALVVIAVATGCPRGDEPRSDPPHARAPAPTDVVEGVTPAAWSADLAELGALRQTAATHHRERRWTDAIAAWREVLARMPDHVGSRYNLACALAQAGELDAAIDEIAAVGRMQLLLPVDQDPELAPLHTHARWSEVVSSIAAAATVAAVRPGTPVALPDFFAEGVAVEGDTMYFGGIVDQSIAKVRDGQAARFAATPDGWSVFGLAVDHQRGWLWAAAAAVPQGRVVPEAIGAAGLFAFSLADGGAAGAWVLDDEGTHLFGDLALAADGTVFTTDTLGGGVHAVAPGTKSLRTVVPSGTLPSPQGLVVFDRDTLVVADYAAGLVAIHLDDAGVADLMRTLPPPVDRTLRGIDGLARRGTTLAAVRNGIAPWAVLRVELAPDAAAIREVTTWHLVDPEAGEPTLVTDGGDALHVMQTDRWDRVFEREGRPRAGVAIAPPQVVSIPWPRG